MESHLWYRSLKEWRKISFDLNQLSLIECWPGVYNDLYDEGTRQECRNVGSINCNFSVAFIKFLNQRSIKPCLICMKFRLTSLLASENRRGGKTTVLHQLWWPHAFDITNPGVLSVPKYSLLWCQFLFKLYIFSFSI